MTPLPDSEIRAELDRILASKGFASAGRISKLLRYVVEKTLAGQADQLKEYAVGVEVFDRDEKYDPRLDSIVRVEAGRLRTKLDEYYNGNGTSSTVRITLPRGGYTAKFEPCNNEQASVPHFHPAPGRISGTEQKLQTAASPKFSLPEGENGGLTQPKRSRAGFAVAAALILTIGGLLVWLGFRDRTPPVDLRPTAAVLPFEANMIGGDNSNYSAQITEAVTSELARLGTISVASYTSAMQFEGKRRPMSEVSAALNSSYVLEASVDDEASEILVVARLVDAATDRKIWVSDYRGQRDDVRGIGQRIAFDVSAAILQRVNQPR